MTADASRRYHILSCRKLARSVYWSCVLYRRKQTKAVNQLMCQLPTYRFVTGHPLFLHTGIDYTGPITIKLGRVKKPVYIKSYLCVLISLPFKAVHLELVSDQTTMHSLLLYTDLLLGMVNQPDYILIIVLTS